MKVIHLAVSALGGAGIAAARSVEALRRQGIAAELWTADDSTPAPSLRRPDWARWRGRLDRLWLRLYRRKRIFSAWSNNWLPSRLAGRINRAAPDLVHLHWVAGGFLSLRELPALRAPVVWTLHDAWALTGGCHYPDQCRGYTAACGRCPQLGSAVRHDLSWFNLRAKRARLGAVAAFVTPSAWLADLAAASGVATGGRLHVIPYGLDGAAFAPRSVGDARAECGLPADATILLAGMLDFREPRKGGEFLPGAVARVVAAVPGRCLLVLFGANREIVGGEWPCEVRGMGVLRDPGEIARLCGAADVFLLPSRQDNFPNLALEAQACGCPVVGFDAGGLREIIEPGRTGWLAAETTATGLGDAVLAWFGAAPDRAAVSVRARARFEREFSLAVHGQRMAALYAMLLGNPRPHG